MALGPGSIAFVGFNADGADNIAFVALEPLPTGTVIFFQDNEWDGAAFNTGESAFSWTATTDVPAGAIVKIDGIGGGAPTADTGSAVFVDSTNPGLSNGGEILYAFVGTSATAPTAFLTAIGSDSLTNGATLSGTGLAAGVTAISFETPTGVDIAAYTGPRSGALSFTEYRAALNNPANWTVQDASGDQSSDGTPPDVPFAGSTFTVTAPTVGGITILPEAPSLAGAATTPAATDAVTLVRLGAFTPASGNAEVVTFDAATGRMFILNTNGNAIDIVRIEPSGALTSTGRIDLTARTDFGGGNSVAVKNGVVAVAFNSATAGDNGHVAFFDTDGAFISQVTVGVMPDQITFTPDGTRLLTANEAEPATAASNPAGSVSIIDMSGGAAAAHVANTISFASLNGSEASLRADGLALLAGQTAANDIEPEYMTISPDGTRAYVTLQEVNAVAVIDLTDVGADQPMLIQPLGGVDHSLDGNAFDASDRDGGIALITAPVTGLLQPDAIASFAVGGLTYFITANEGDSRVVYTDSVRFGDASYVLDPTAFPNAAALKANVALGRLNVLTNVGDTDGDGDFDRIYTLGGRGFSIFRQNADGTIEKVRESGGEFERIIAALPNAATVFNQNQAAGTFDTRSDDKGPEPEGVDTGLIGTSRYAFIGLERMGGVMVYDVTDPANARFVSYMPAAANEHGPEVVKFIAAADSPTGTALVLTANEVSGTTTVYAALAAGAQQTIGFAAGSLTVAAAEGNGGTTTMSFVVERSGGMLGEVQFSVRLSGGGATAGDFAGSAALPRVIVGTIAAGQASTTVTVEVAADTALEPDESFALTLLSATGTQSGMAIAIDGARDIAQGTIVNDEPLTQTGDASDQSFTPTSGNDAIDGAGGSDTVVYDVARSAATIARTGPGAWTVTAAGGGTDHLVNVEMVKFTDTTLHTTSQTPYLTASQPNVHFVSLLSAGDVAGVKPDGTTPWKMVGVPDGLGAFDNGDGTITLVMNQEISAGIVRASGNSGAFVSRLVIDKATLSVVSASDADSQVFIWNTTTQAYDLLTASVVARLCSADLALPAAFFNAASGLGTTDRIFLNGEETGAEGRPFAHVLTGTDQGKAFELPKFGNAAWENLLARPVASDKTVVIGTDDSTGGQLYVYIGAKQATGSTLDKAGLANGALYGIKADFASEASPGMPLSGSFTLAALPDETNRTGAELQSDSATAGVTGWLRPEDGAWDTVNPNRFYFVTTNAISAPSRLWALDFVDPTDPSKGGTYTALLDGTEGQKMLDNLTVSADGTLILQEDVGNNARSGRVWHYDPRTDTLTQVAQHDVTRFGDETTAPTAPFTIDEESSGIIDVTALLGSDAQRAFLLDTQAHYPATGPDAAEVVEGGQLQLMLIDTAINGTDADNTLAGTFIDEIIDGGAGTDTLVYAVNRAQATIVQTAAHTWKITTPGGGTDTVSNVERFQFADRTIAAPYTLQILHFYGESGMLGTDTAPILGAMVDKFRAGALNTLTLAEGDSWIPGPWLVGGADPSLNAVPGIGSTALARPDVAIMNALGVNASSLGNHEFDLGSPVVSGAIGASGSWVGAQFPFITSNLTFAADNSLRGLADATLGGTGTNAFAGKEASTIKGKIAPYTVVTLNGETIGIVGATTYDLLTKTSPNGTVPKDDANPSTSELEEVAAYIQVSVDALRAAGVNKIVMVDQLDTISRNQALAPLVSGIDVMVAGGGHERLGDANDVPAAFNGHDASFVGTYPIMVNDKDGNPTLVVTTDTEYSYLGRLQVQFDGNGVIDTSALNSTINGAYAANQATLQQVYGTTQTAEQIVAGSTTGTKVAAITSAIDAVVTAKDGNKFGFSNVYLEGDRVYGRAEETNLGNLSADANAVVAHGALAISGPVVSLKNGGGLRASIGSIDEDGGKVANPLAPGAAGNVSQLDIENALRFDNRLMVFDTTPQGLLNILNYAATLAPGNGGFPQVGGLRYSYDPDNPVGSKVQDIALYDDDGHFVTIVANDGVISPTAPATIPVVILNFTANGGDGYPIKANGENFRYLLTDGTVSGPVDEALDFTAAANVPANTLGEQKAFQDYMLARHGTAATAFNQADTAAAQDLRIENLNVVPLDAVIPCFAEGTRIATPTGEVTVETLAVGDEVKVVLGAGTRRIIWIGTRTVDCRRHPEPAKVRPIRIKAGAFGPKTPSRTLWLSPDHAVYVNDVLIPVKHLVNGTTVAQPEVDLVTYFHIELEEHDVVLANGLKAESYLDTGDRANFGNADGVIRLFPDFSGDSRALWMWEALGCAPLKIVGPEVEATRALLDDRAGKLPRKASKVA